MSDPASRDGAGLAVNCTMDKSAEASSILHSPMILLSRT